MGKTSSTIYISGPAFCHQAGMFSVMPRRQALVSGESVLVTRVSPIGNSLCPEELSQAGGGHTLSTEEDHEPSKSLASHIGSPPALPRSGPKGPSSVS